MSYDIYRIYTDELLTAQCYSVKLIHTVSKLLIVKELLGISEQHNWLCMAYTAKTHLSNHYQKRGLRPLANSEMYLVIPNEPPVMATHHATLFLRALERQRRKEGYYADTVQHTTSDSATDAKGYSKQPASIRNEGEGRPSAN